MQVKSIKKIISLIFFKFLYLLAIGEKLAFLDTTGFEKDGTFGPTPFFHTSDFTNPLRNVHFWPCFTDIPGGFTEGV